ncbi:hypothetical protein ACFQPA_12225 [Halomarina halobia]|uniref:DUF5666 domain-containing protein n=1 Tax=Halomarina halobia TaxID=3033386 RepID=A0ABD6AAF2_9EURY|nr:hypothetical protein [Halomarina sp. PSR21]
MARNRPGTSRLDSRPESVGDHLKGTAIIVALFIVPLSAILVFVVGVGPGLYDFTAAENATNGSDAGNATDGPGGPGRPGAAASTGASTETPAETPAADTPEGTPPDESPTETSSSTPTGTPEATATATETPASTETPTETPASTPTPAPTPAPENRTLVVERTDENASANYTVNVTGGIRANDSVEPDDAIGGDGRSVTGTVDDARDAYTFTGEVERAEVVGNATISVDGEIIAPRSDRDSNDTNDTNETRSSNDTNDTNESG